MSKNRERPLKLTIVFLVLILYVFLFINCASADEFWVSNGFNSYHNDQKSHYNQDNYGASLGWKINKDNSLIIGEYKNSIKHDSKFIAWEYLPIHNNNINLGFTSVLVTGYLKNPNNLAIAPFVPTLSYIYKNVGFTILEIPGVVTAITFKIKLY